MVRILEYLGLLVLRDSGRRVTVLLPFPALSRDQNRFGVSRQTLLYGVSLATWCQLTC